MKHLDDIEARLKAATPGPWAIDEHDPSSLESIVSTAIDRPWGWVEVARSLNPDATLIAHAPDDLARTTNALRGVLELHKRTKWEPGHPRPTGAQEHGLCGWCGDTYPCLTAATITEALQGEQ